MTKKKIPIMLFCVFFITVLAAQERFPADYPKVELRGFVKSPTEHIIIPIESPFEVARVEGIITMPGGDPPGALPVIFEIRPAEQKIKILKAVVKSNGQFKITKVPPGKYFFKATANGFQSVIGTIVVSKQADRKKIIAIQFNYGV